MHTPSVRAGRQCGSSIDNHCPVSCCLSKPTQQAAAATLKTTLQTALSSRHHIAPHGWFVATSLNVTLLLTLVLTAFTRYTRNVLCKCRLQQLAVALSSKPYHQTNFAVPAYRKGGSTTQNTTASGGPLQLMLQPEP